MNKSLAILVISSAFMGCLYASPIDIESSATDLVVEKEASSAHPDAAAAEAVINDECRQPKEIGRCFALFYRFAFNMDTLACEEFIYGGCAGNSNNFETKEECEQHCKAQNAATEQTEVTTELATEANEAEVIKNSSTTPANVE